MLDRAAAVLSDGAAIGFYDRVTDTTTCYVNPDRRLNTTSIVMVLIATALQWRASRTVDRWNSRRPPRPPR